MLSKQKTSMSEKSGSRMQKQRVYPLHRAPLRCSLYKADETPPLPWSCRTYPWCFLRGAAAKCCAWLFRSLASHLRQQEGRSGTQSLKTGSFYPFGHVIWEVSAAVMVMASLGSTTRTAAVFAWGDSCMCATIAQGSASQQGPSRFWQQPGSLTTPLGGCLVLVRPGKGHAAPHGVAIYGLGAGNRTRCQDLCMASLHLHTAVALPVFPLAFSLLMWQKERSHKSNCDTIGLLGAAFNFASH